MSNTLNKRYLSPNEVAKFNLTDFMDEVRTLDPKEPATWSRHVTIASWILIALMTTAVTFMIAVKPAINEVTKVEKTRKKLLGEYDIKKKQLIGLQQYESQLTQMENQFRQQLNQLPKEAEIPGLIEDVGAAGRSSGLKLENLALSAEVPREVFIEQPITMNAIGDFHAFGAFVTAVAELPRIVTIQDFKIEMSKPAAGSTKPVIDYTIKANTYRYLEAPPKPIVDTSKADKKSKKDKKKDKKGKDKSDAGDA